MKTFVATGALLMASFVAVAAGAKPVVGEKAPEFTAPSTAGPLSLKDLRGHWVVLYFYPKSFTPGCTAEAGSLRDGSEGLRNLKATVIGVSTDDLSTQREFKEKLSLPFELVADSDKTVTKLYDVQGWLGMAKRRTFLIDPEGVLRAVIDDVDTRKHAEQVRDLLQSLGAGKSTP